MNLLDALVFDTCNGTLVTSQGIVPNFERTTPAYAEFEVNGSLKLVGAAAGEPRVSVNGAVYLEDESVNYCLYSTQFSHPTWVKGSSWSILPDRVPGMAGTYTADRCSIAATLGNEDAQTMYQDFVFGSGETYTATVFIKLASGRFGVNDCFRLSNGVASTVTVLLGTELNDRPGNWVALSATFTTAGTAPPNYEDEDTARTVRFSIFVENAVSFDLGGVQIEPGTVRTSFIESEIDSAKVASRAADVLTYPTNPVEGLRSFVFYTRLEAWRGDGLIFQAGNFTVDINSGRVRATAGAVSVQDTDNLPASAKIAVRVSQGLERLRLYVNKVLKAQATLTGYAATAGSPQIAGEGMRLIKPLYLFNRDIGDGSISIGQSVLADLLTLHNQDSLFPELSEGYGIVSFAPIQILPGDSASVRLPQIRFANQPISTAVLSGSPVAQQSRITVRTILNAAAVQRDAVTINSTTFEFTSDATPTVAEIATGLANMINSTPKMEAVTASPSGAAVTITADTAGDPFYISVTDNISLEQLTPNTQGTFTITVPNAVDFEVGPASVYRGNVWIADVTIDTINTLTNTLTLLASRNSDFLLILPADSLVQPLWQSRFPRTGYFVSHLEDHPDIRLTEKTDRFFTFKNLGSTDRIVTPRVRVVL